MRAVIVAAVSTEAQAAEDRASIPDQLQVCRQACASHGWQIVAEVTIPGHSRDYVWLEDLEDACPEYRQLMDLVRANGCELVVVRHYDRLWRTSPLQGQVMAVCTQHRVQVYSVLQPMEPVPPEELRPRRGLQGIMELLSGAISEEEQRLRVERRRAGVDRRIAEGKPGSWTDAPIGYDLVDGQLLVDPEWASLVQWVYQQRIDGHGVVWIMRRLNERGLQTPRGAEWGYSTLWRMLRNPTYKGATYAGAAYNPDGEHEAIVDAETWERVQRINATRRHWGKAKTVHVLTGLARCGYCDWAMSYSQNNAGALLRCSQYAHTGGRACQSNSHMAHLVEDPVLEAVQEVLNDKDAWAEAQRQRLQSDDTDREIALLQSRRDDARAQRLRLLDAYQMGGLPREELEDRVQ